MNYFEIDYLRASNILFVDCEIDKKEKTLYAEYCLIAATYDGQTIELTNEDDNVIVEITAIGDIVSNVPKIITEFKLNINSLKK